MMDQTPGRNCINCGEFIPRYKSGHFVPPSLGEAGFYICKEIKELDNKKKESQADGSQHEGR